VGLYQLFVPLIPSTSTHHHHQSSLLLTMPATCITLGDITPTLCRRDGSSIIESTYIRPFDPAGNALETATQAWSQYNRHLFQGHRDLCLSLYPTVDTVYQRSATWEGSDDTFKDLFLDDMWVRHLLAFVLADDLP
jgi:hypothetical protein